jgi:hypothetical protein
MDFRDLTPDGVISEPMPLNADTFEAVDLAAFAAVPDDAPDPAVDAELDAWVQAFMRDRDEPDYAAVLDRLLDQEAF